MHVNDPFDTNSVIMTPILSTSANYEFSASFTSTSDDLQKILSAPLGELCPQSGTVIKMELEFPVTVPVRRHKKRRIQKKWLERYGTKTVYADKRKFRTSRITVVEDESGTGSVYFDSMEEIK